MPVLIELHEKFHDKGLAVVGVHVDIDGDVATVAKFDEMNSMHVKDVWKGKKLPFPNALVAGKRESEDGPRGALVKEYGVISYPTTVLIDREGKVVGKFHARDIKAATAEVEKLLAG
jgi:thiol-disulfide isomerase/thioredoxin